MTCDRSNAARKSSLCCCHRTSLIRWLKQCQKKRSKSGLYSVQGKIGIFWCRKNRRNRGKIMGAWQYYVLDRYVCQRTSNFWFDTFHEGFSLQMWVSLKAEGKHMCWSSWSTPSTGQVIRVHVLLSWWHLVSNLEVLTACRPQRLLQSWIYSEQHICESNSSW